LRFAGLVRRGLRAEAVMPGPRRGEYYIGHLGVAPALRGCGIGAALLRHLLEAGLATGAARAVLDVSVENPRAEALYAKLGFRVAATRPSDVASAFGRVPGHRRMVRELGA
jgi:ribosomal protein S18 acetylase RimI-like enzyme